MPDRLTKISPSDQFLAYIKQRALSLRDGDCVPSTRAAWETAKKSLRAELERSWGPFPRQACPLEPKILGELKREGYRVEKLTFQTRPGIQLTANAYVPSGGGRRPAVLCVHGHWSGAKQDPTVQARCIGLAKLGFFVLVVDAFGAGERGLGKKLGEYHGEMVAGTLFPTGLTLAGLQVYENMRAVDYLQSRSEVDGAHIGITGASGGGNQTMYAGAYDERIGCVVPTCSVGTYQSYLGAACCMCELIPSALTYTEEWGLLAMVAPRGLMLINATRDAFQFSVGEAKKSLSEARKVFALYGKPHNAAHAVFASKHDYNQPMREAMYGWMTLHLKAEGNGHPLREPKIAVEDPETLRCYPGNSRPESFITLPQFAAAEGLDILARRKLPDHREHWLSEAESMTEALSERVLGRFPKRLPLQVQTTDNPDDSEQIITFDPEPGITLAAHRRSAGPKKEKLAILLHPTGRAEAFAHPLATQLEEAGWDLITLDLRATGELAYPRDRILNAPDHNTAQWSIWTGRPLLGQWTWDVSRLLDALAQTAQGLPKQTVLVGLDSAGVIALTAAALDRRIAQVVTVEMLAGYVSAEPYRGQRFGIIVPGILRELGDIPHLAALTAPRGLLIAGGVHGNGTPLKQQALAEQFAYTHRVYALEGVQQNLSIFAAAEPREIVRQLNQRALEK